MGEAIFENIPRKINELKNYKYYFSCSNVLNHLGNNINEESSKILKDDLRRDYQQNIPITDWYILWKWGKIFSFP